MNSKRTPFWVLSILLLVIGTWILVKPQPMPSYGGKSIEYWFNLNLRASRGSDYPEVQQAMSRRVDISLAAFKAMGTNGFPYLFKLAFSTNRDSFLYPFLCKAITHLPYSWHVQPPVSEEERSGRAVEIVCACKPDTSDVLPFLTNLLNGTNTDLHSRALRVLGSAINPLPATGEYLARDFADPNPTIQFMAFLPLAEDAEKVEVAVPFLLSSFNKAEARQFPLPLVLHVIPLFGDDAIYCVPFLERAFSSEPNWNTRCDIANSLVRIKPSETNFVLPALEAGFEAETNWETRFHIATRVLQFDKGQTNEVSFLGESWETRTNPVERSRIWGALTPFVPTNLPNPNIPLAVLQYRSPPFERWLELGEEVQTSQPGQTVEQWLAIAENVEPEYQGRTLRQWLESAAPAPSSEATFKDLAAARKHCEEAVYAMGTNAIPWLVAWLQSTNEDYTLARRGFGILKSVAKPAVSALTQMAQTNLPSLRNHAYSCLKGLCLDWTTIWPALVPVLHNPDQSVRDNAAIFLYHNFREQAEAVGLKEFVSPADTELAE